MSEPKSNKIILVAPGQQRLQFGAIIHLPLALLSLAAWLQEKGNYHGMVSILDTQIHSTSPQLFKETLVVGISAMTGTQIKYGLNIAAMARKVNPDIVIVWGGIHPSLLPGQTIQHPLVDVVVSGEGEQTFLEVVEAIFDGKEIHGIPGTYTINDKDEIVQGPYRAFLDMDELPLPAYDLIDIRSYIGIEHQFDYQSSRGCPFRCGFCYNTVFCGRHYRKKSASKVVNELIILNKKYHIKNFAFVDDEFFIYRKRIEDIFKCLENETFGIIASCRLDIIQKFTPEFITKIKEYGIIQIFFGAESGSDRILKKINKDISTQDILKGAAFTAKNGIRPILSFMSGFPGETIEDFKYTIDIILKLWKIHPLITVNGIFPFNAYPGTALFQESIFLGLKPPKSLEEWGNWNFQYKPDNPWLTEDMKECMKITFYMVRFKYYIARYEDRYKNSVRVLLMKILTSPLSFSTEVRLKKRWFKMAWEWKLFAYFAKKTFGYI